MLKINNMDWHSLRNTKVLNIVETIIELGLNSEEVGKRKKQFGMNKLTQKKTTSPFVLFLMQFNQPLVYILIAATIVTALLKEFIDSGVIFGVVLVNSIIGFLQESKAIKAIESLAKSMTSETTVIRNGKKQRIPASELTIGDVVVLQSGLISCKNLFNRHLILGKRACLIRAYYRGAYCDVLV